MGHSNWAEWIYVAVVIALLVYVGAEAWNIENLIEHVPEDAEVIKVTAQQWFWSFEHEDGTKEIGELHLKKDHAYKFEIESKMSIIISTYMNMLYCWMQFLGKSILSGSLLTKLVSLIYSVGNIVA